MPKTTTFSLLLALLHLCPLAAKPIDVFFGTGGGQSEPRASTTPPFNPDNGKFSFPPSWLPRLAIDLARLFDSSSPMEKFFTPWVVGRAERVPSDIKFPVANSRNSPVWPAPMAEVATLRFTPSGKFLLTAQYGGGSQVKSPFFPLDSYGKNWANPP